MASPFPLIAYWDGDPPSLAAVARALRAGLGSETAVELHPAAERPATTPAGKADATGFVVPLPAGAELFLEGRRRNRVEFAISGADPLLPFGPAEQATTAATVRSALVALVARAGAVAAWCGRVREEFMASEMDAFDERMRERRAGDPLPFSAIAGGVWMAAWRADLPGDLPCDEREDDACVARLDDGPLS